MNDVILLTKPKITLMATLVALAGLFHASEFPSLGVLPSLGTLFGIALLVSSSSALNMYLERKEDALMERTKSRPLPSKRLKPLWALWVSLFTLSFSVPLMLLGTNKNALILGLFSFLMYVFCYTPLKKITWVSLIIGSIPGAMPVVLGYLAKSGQLDEKALALFLWAFLWQIPHFLAISLFRKEEYVKAGFKVMPFLYGEKVTHMAIILFSWFLVFSSVFLYMTKITSSIGFLLSIILGAWFLYVVHKKIDKKWAKNIFIASLIYQTLLFVLIVFEGLILYAKN